MVAVHFRFQFRGQESRTYISHFPALIHHLVFPSVGDKDKKKLLVVHIRCERWTVFVALPSFQAIWYMCTSAGGGILAGTARAVPWEVDRANSWQLGCSIPSRRKETGQTNTDVIPIDTTEKEVKFVWLADNPNIKRCYAGKNVPDAPWDLVVTKKPFRALWERVPLSSKQLRTLHISTYAQSVVEKGVSWLKLTTTN